MEKKYQTGFSPFRLLRAVCCIAMVSLLSGQHGPARLKNLLVTGSEVLQEILSNPCASPLTMSENLSINAVASRFLPYFATVRSCCGKERLVIVSAAHFRGISG